MTALFGLDLAPRLLDVWHAIPNAIQEAWSQSCSPALNRQETVALLLARHDLLAKWCEAEARRTEAPGDSLPGDRSATRYEEYLMRLLQFDNLTELQQFLNGPSHPGFLEQSQVPEEAYELLQKEREQEERDVAHDRSLFRLCVNAVWHDAPESGTTRPHKAGDFPPDLFNNKLSRTLLTLCLLAGAYSLFQWSICLLFLFRRLIVGMFR